MSSNSEEAQKPTIAEIIERLGAGTLRETSFPRLELKSSWQKRYGEDISAIANHESCVGGWMVLGVADDGRLKGLDESWARQSEQVISNQINEFLSPYWAAKEVTLKVVNGSYVIIVDIVSPGDVTEWDRESYRLSGTVSTKMSPDEKIALAFRLPGEDFTKQHWAGDINAALVIEFAQKIKSAHPAEFPESLNDLSSSEILDRLHLKDTIAAKVLFGPTVVRIVHYDQNEDVLDNESKMGAFNLVTDDFVSHVQGWTRKQGTILLSDTTSVREESPYPPVALREVLANAVAHALYQREDGGIIVDLHPDRMVVRNNAMLESRLFTKQWFSKKTFVKNKVLMTALRTAKITDELGTGKARIFRQMLEAGKREPIVDFTEVGTFGKWELTIYNEEQDGHFKILYRRLSEIYSSANQARLAAALVLWRNHSWNSIQEKLDDYYKRLSLEVVRFKDSPVFVVGDEIYVRRWAEVTLSGQESRSFTPVEEKKLFEVLKSFAFAQQRNGYITTSEAKTIIGLSNRPSETTQLSNLFRKWKKDGSVSMIKRGHWRFLSEGERIRVLMSFFYEHAAKEKKD